MAVTAIPGTNRPRFDVRLVIGGTLVLVSALGVWALVAGLDDTVEVVAAKAALAPGSRLEADDVAIARVRLGEAEGRYLTPEQLQDGGILVTRTVLEGELVPASAVDPGADAQSAAVVVAASANLPSGVRAGALVDLWSAPAEADGAVAPPAVLVPGAEVVSIGEAASGMGGQRRPVELVVPRSALAAVLAALAAGDVVDLVPAAGAGGR